MLDKEKEKIKCKNGSKFISELSDNEKEFLKFDNIPLKVLNEINNYPENFFIDNLEERKKWKIIDYNENIDGSGVITQLYISDDLFDITKRVTSNIFFINSDDLFELEKNQLEKGILKDVNEKTLDKHILENTFKNKDLKQFKIKSILGTIEENMDDIIEIKNNKTIKKKEFGKMEVKI
jgi:hypothetical protein